MKFETMNEALKLSQKQPALGVTQGGSSRKNGGARVAARNADAQQRRKPKGAKTNG